MTLLEPRPVPSLGRRTAPPWAEPALAFAACTLVALLAMRRLLEPDVYSDDALVHQYWMWHWRDAALFTDPLTAQLRESARYPDGYQALFWLASHVTAPIRFGEWLGVLLMALSGWLVFAIVRDHEPWRPAAWLAAALFLALVDIHRFHGGFPRGFVHPVVLATVLLAMRRRDAAAAGVAAGGALLYPPAALLAVGVLAVSAVRRSGLDRRRALVAGAAVALALAPCSESSSSRAARRACSARTRRARSPSSARTARCATSRTRRSATCARTAAGSTCGRPGAC